MRRQRDIYHDAAKYSTVEGRPLLASALEHLHECYLGCMNPTIQSKETRIMRMAVQALSFLLAI